LSPALTAGTGKKL